MKLKDKKVLVTGSDGFIGSHLVEALLKEQCKIRAFVYYNSFNSWGWLDTLSRNDLKGIDVFSGDIRDPNAVRKAIKDIDVVFHLAALIGIPFSYNSPDSYIDTNVKGTSNILQACMDFKIEKVIVTSTSEVYGTAQYVPIDETHPLQAQSPYSATKIGLEKLAESFHCSFNAPVIIARPFNTYGPRQSLRAVIPTVIMQLLSGQNEVRLGSLVPTRDFSYVKDTCQGFVDIACSEKLIGEEINIASGTEISIGEVAQEIIDQINPKAKIVYDKERARPDKSEVKRLVGCNKKIRNLTGWKSGYDLKNGLSETIQWFRRFKESKNAALYDPYKAEAYNI